MGARRVDLTSSVVVVAAGREIDGADAVLADHEQRETWLPVVHRAGTVGGCGADGGLLLLTHQGPCSGEPVAEVSRWLRDATAAALAAGVPADRLVIDAGIDTKPWDEALALLRATATLVLEATPLAVATLGGAWTDPGKRAGAQAFAITRGCRVVVTADTLGGRRVADVTMAVERP